MHGFDFRILGALLVVAALTATVSQRLSLPYSIGRVAARGAVALLAPGSAPPLTRD